MRARWLFVGTMFTGSFLLFLVQPLVARMALPRLGGAPAVWNSAMLVYQLLLLGGYAYAHVLGRRAPRQQALVHLALFALAALWLPLSLGEAEPPAGIAPALWVPWLLARSVGPLFFVVSAQAPLMQRWFALAGGGEPYALYAASNLGSLLGLLAYPLVLEPNLRLGAQTLVWSAGYALLAGCVLVAAFTLRAALPDARHEAPTARPTMRLRARWLLLAAVPSGLMLSTTTHLTTDIVAVPMLWVVPLALYLLSFTIAFAARRTVADFFGRVAPYVLLVGGTFAFASSTDYPVAYAGLGLVLLLTAAVSLHGEMYRTRPAAAHLTEFYMVMSIGGVLGGALCALIAPLVFDWAYEHPLLVWLAAALSPTARWPGSPARDRLVTRLAPWALLAALSLSLIGGGLLWRSGGALVSGIATALLLGLTTRLATQRSLYVLCFALLMASGGGWSSLELSAAHTRERSYFGIYTVIDGAHHERVLNHGTTVHGVQSRERGHELDATTYYGPRSGVGLALTAAPELFGPAARIGVVGLGAGTLACYARPGQRWRFYEIDPVVVRIARDPAQFSFLARCAAAAPIVIGDARLSLEREPAAQLDVLVVDAFSSDTVPVHLLTAEAFAVYARALAPSGLLLVHVSNRHFELDAVVAAAASTAGFDARLRAFVPSAAEKARHQTGSRWIALSRDPDMLARLTSGHERDYADIRVPAGSTPWRDDYASLLPLLLR